jgi:hypothetical protein
LPELVAGITYLMTQQANNVQLSSYLANMAMAGEGGSVCGEQVMNEMPRRNIQVEYGLDNSMSVKRAIPRMNEVPTKVGRCLGR